MLRAHHLTHALVQAYSDDDSGDEACSLHDGDNSMDDEEVRVTLVVGYMDCIELH
jgi:hypothetical protein